MQNNSSTSVQKFHSIAYKDISLALAHGFENLLGGIVGYAMVLKQQFADDPVLSAEINIILASAQRAVDLTKMLEGYTKFELGHRILCDLNEIVQRGVDLVFCTIPKNIKLSTQLGVGLNGVEADATQVLQILMLLSFYARSCILEGGEITFYTHKFENNCSDVLDCGSTNIDNFICLGVSFAAQEGKKVSEEEEFHRNNLLNSFGFEEFVASHKVWTRTVKRKGSLGIEIYFPAFGEEFEVREIEQLSHSRVLGLKDKGVLVVDDDEIIRTLPVDILSDFGTHIFTATNGREGLDMFIKHRHELDVVLMDVMMPLMDGIKAFYSIREIDAKIPVIFISGYSEVKDLQPILSKEKNVGFLGKPFSNQALVELILKFVSQASQI